MNKSFNLLLSSSFQVDYVFLVTSTAAIAESSAMTMHRSCLLHLLLVSAIAMATDDGMFFFCISFPFFFYLNGSLLAKPETAMLQSYWLFSNFTLIILIFKLGCAEDETIYRNKASSFQFCGYRKKKRLIASENISS